MVDKSDRAKSVRGDLKFAAIIPARMASTRFPGKPLAKINGMPMIVHVMKRVMMNKNFDKVIVATCDDEIKKVVEAAGGTVVLTSDKHERCTDRVSEAAKDIDADVIINVQGDVPMIYPEALGALIRPFRANNNVLCVDLIAPINSREEFEDPNVVKIVVGRNGDALYYSREAVPSSKKASGDFKKFKQIGIIAFKKDFLFKFSGLEMTPLEKVESIDMLRVLEHGLPVKTAVTTLDMRGVDTPQDLKRAEEEMKSDRLVKEYQ